jgi:tetratricopeptide (TPR) repeat protein
MQKAIALFAVIHIGRALAQVTLPDSMAETWFDMLQRAVNMSKHAQYREAINQYQALLSKLPIESNTELHAYILSQMADVEIELGQYQDAEAAAGDALRRLSSAGKAHTGTYAITEGVLADTLRAQGNYAEAKRLAEHALILAEDTLKTMPPRIGILLTTLGQILQESGELRRAEQLCRRAVSIFQEGDPSDVSLGNAYQNLAVIYVKRGKLKQAMDAVTNAIASWNKALPPHHPFEVFGLSTKIVVYQEQRAFREAEQIIPEALKLALTLFGPDHPERMILLNNCAGVYLAERKYVEAEVLLHEAADIGRHRLAAGHPLLNNVLRNHSYALEKLKRKDEAARARAESEVLLAFPKRSNFYVVR